MVFGNFIVNLGVGVLFLCNLIIGVNELFGEWLFGG